MPRKPNDVAGVFEKNFGSGVWYIRYRAGGKSVRKRIGTRAEALTALDKVKYIRSTGDGVLAKSAKEYTRTKEQITKLGPSGILLNDLCDKYLAHIQDEDNPDRPDDQVNPPQRIRAIKETFGDRPAAGILPYEVTDWLKGLKLAPATLNRYKSTFSSVYRYGKERAIVTVNPVRDVPQFKVLLPDPRYLKPEEEAGIRAVLDRWIADCPDHHKLTKLFLRSHHHEVTLAIATGMRKGNLYQLEWRNVDFNRGIIHMPKTKPGFSHTVPMINDARQALLDQKKIQAEIEELQASSERKSTRMVAGNRVFNISENREWWDQALEEAQVHDFRWHDLRHTTGSRLAQAGKSLKVIQQALGHKTIAMAARYSHMDQSSMHEAMEVLNRKNP